MNCLEQHIVNINKDFNETFANEIVTAAITAGFHDYCPVGNDEGPREEVTNPILYATRWKRAKPWYDNLKVLTTEQYAFIVSAQWLVRKSKDHTLKQLLESFGVTYTIETQVHVEYDDNGEYLGEYSWSTLNCPILGLQHSASNPNRLLMILITQYAFPNIDVMTDTATCNDLH